MSTLHLRPFQSTAIHFLQTSKIHLALTAPTGAGKGVILEELARDPAERILLFSPLIALARQQRVRFKRAGAENRVKIMSPESGLFRRKEISAWKPTLIAVDEAHCLQEWGGHFRPAYGELLDFIRDLGCPRTLWMSATFPRRLELELTRSFPGEWMTLGTFEMPENLSTIYHRISPSERIETVRSEIMSKHGPGLLFAGTRKEVGHYLKLISPLRPALPYHAGLSDEERRSVEARLEFESEGETPQTSIIATNAFGMGMDYPQFTWAVLSRIPFSLLSLMQTFGRVGRSGKFGTADLYWSEEDFRFAGLLTQSSNGPVRAERDLEQLREFLEAKPKERHEILKTVFI